MNENCVIDARNLGVTFDGNVILRDVDICVRAGEVMAIIGGSGSGKTTLLRLMLGLERPTSGEAYLFGRAPVSRAGEHRVDRRVGVLFQAGALFSALSVFDNVALPLRELKTVPEDAIRRLVMHKLDLVEIDAGSAAKMPAELSGGMVKRVALARAIALDPELLFLDEPTSGLDPKRAHDFVQLIESLRRQLHLTVVMATHDVDTVIALADRVGVLADGRLVALAPLPDLLRDPHPYVRSFFVGREQQCERGAARDLRDARAHPGPGT